MARLVDFEKRDRMVNFRLTQSEQDTLVKRAADMSAKNPAIRGLGDAIRAILFGGAGVPGPAADDMGLKPLVRKLGNPKQAGTPAKAEKPVKEPKPVKPAKAEKPVKEAKPAKQAKESKPVKEPKPAKVDKPAKVVKSSIADFIASAKPAGAGGTE